MSTEAVEFMLNRGYVAIIDREDAERVGDYNWNAYVSCRTHYAVAAIGYCVISMHRYIIHAKKGQIVDHINHN